jgi:plastocyanin
MTDPRSEFRKRHLLRHVLLLSAIAGALLSLGVVSGFAADKSVETAGTIGTYHWQPSTAEINPNGTVEFKNAQAIPHGLAFEAPPAAPSCTGIPSVGTANWSGTCTFTQAGTYSFYCPVHPAEMKGTITVSGPVAPVVTTEPATGINETEATLNGKVNPSSQATTYFFMYGTTTAYGQETTPGSAGAGGAAVSKFATVSGLTAATTYHFQMVAENASGTTRGADRTFTTTGPPTATTGPATGVGSIEATLKGTVNPRGLATEYFFNYGTTIAYGQDTAKKAAGSGISGVSASQLVSGLSPETTYHFQLVATNVSGTDTGADLTFKTAANPPPPPPPPPPLPPLGSTPLPLTPAVMTSPPPETRITTKPKAKTADRTPTLKFSSASSGASFECQVDGTAFRACRSPLTTKVLSFGKHTVKVRAVLGDVQDPTPATVSFKVVKAH